MIIMTQVAICDWCGKTKSYSEVLNEGSEFVVDLEKGWGELFTKEQRYMYDSRIACPDCRETAKQDGWEE